MLIGFSLVFYHAAPTSSYSDVVASLSSVTAYTYSHCFGEKCMNFLHFKWYTEFFSGVAITGSSWSSRGLLFPVFWVRPFDILTWSSLKQFVASISVTHFVVVVAAIWVFLIDSGPHSFALWTLFLEIFFFEQTWVLGLHKLKWILLAPWLFQHHFSITAITSN